MCRTRSEFDELCVNLQTQINDAGVQPLFEIAKTGYTPWISQMTQAEMDIRASGSLQEGKSIIVKFLSDDSERFYLSVALWQGWNSSVLNTIYESFVHNL